MKDPYLQENGTLKNKLKISDTEKLKVVESSVVFSKLLTISQLTDKQFNLDYLKNIHKYLFEDVYEWAGKFRTIPMEKPETYFIPGLSVKYEEPENIETELISLLNSLNSEKWESLSIDQKSIKFTKYIAELWKIHPFREGNTRTSLVFASEFSKYHNFPLDFEMLLGDLQKVDNTTPDNKQEGPTIRDFFVGATIDEYPEPEYLVESFKRAMISGIKKQIKTLEKNLGER